MRTISRGGSALRRHYRCAAARLLVLTGAGAFFTTISCSSGESPTDPNPAPFGVATILVYPATAYLSVGESIQLTATAKDSAGHTLSGRSIAWSTSAATIAIVDTSGLVRGESAGQAAITATSGGKADTATVTVAAAVATVTIDPGDLTLVVGTSRQLAATLRDAGGDILTGRPIAWSSSNWAIANVRATGDAAATVRGETTGEVTISATSEGQTGSAVIRVEALQVVGEKIVFNTDRDGDDEIYLMDPDGTNLINLTRHPASDIHPTWSPDGSQVAFASDRTGKYQIYRMNADGSDLMRLTNGGAADLFPSWSGTKIAFERWLALQEGGLEIFVMNEDGTGAVNLTNEAPAFDRAPSLSPDGSKIVFASDRDWDSNGFQIVPEIYVMNSDGSDPVNLSNTDTSSDAFPEWSPDGLRIAFESDRGGAFDIFVMNADGSNPVNVTNGNGGGGCCVSWAPDGNTLIFASDRSGNSEIYRIALDGTDLATLTSHSANDAWPAWRPWP